MPKLIISDTSCLIILEKIGELSILQSLYGTILTTAEVAAEFGQPLPDWIQIRQPSDINYRHILTASLDLGEASAIALALECDDALLIIDDLKGRNFALRLGLRITGTLGILVEAKLAGHLSALKPVLQKIKQTNFRLTERLEALVLSKVNE